MRVRRHYSNLWRLPDWCLCGGCYDVATTTCCARSVALILVRSLCSWTQFKFLLRLFFQFVFVFWFGLYTQQRFCKRRQVLKDGHMYTVGLRTRGVDCYHSLHRWIKHLLDLPVFIFLMLLWMQYPDKIELLMNFQQQNLCLYESSCTFGSCLTSDFTLHDRNLGAFLCKITRIQVFLFPWMLRSNISTAGF